MKKTCIAFTSVIVLSFIVLIWVGTEVYQTQPPIPDLVINKDTGDTLNFSSNISSTKEIAEQCLDEKLLRVYQ